MNDETVRKEIKEACIKQFSYLIDDTFAVFQKTHLTPQQQRNLLEFKIREITTSYAFCEPFVNRSSEVSNTQ